MEELHAEVRDCLIGTGLRRFTMLSMARLGIPCVLSLWQFRPACLLISYFEPGGSMLQLLNLSASQFVYPSTLTVSISFWTV